MQFKQPHRQSGGHPEPEGGKILPCLLVECCSKRGKAGHEDQRKQPATFVPMSLDYRRYAVRSCMCIHSPHYCQREGLYVVATRWIVWGFSTVRERRFTASPLCGRSTADRGSCGVLHLGAEEPLPLGTLCPPVPTTKYRRHTLFRNTAVWLCRWSG